jgi:rsbT co-antagonist protein RsbR
MPSDFDEEQLRGRILALEAALSQQEERTRLILQSSLEGFHLVGADARILDCNDIFASTLGYSRDALVGRLITDIDVDPPEVIDACIKIVLEQGAHRFLAKHQHKEGHLIDVEVSVHLVKIGDEELFSSFCHPITEQLAREKALRESEQKFRAIFDQTSTLISLLAPDGSVLECNRTMLEFAGANPGELTGTPFSSGPFTDPSTQAREALESALARAALGDPAACEVAAQGSDGRTATFDLRIKPILDSSGKPTLLIAEAYDISEQKRALAERMSLQAKVISAQEATIRELSTPLIPLDAGIAVMPLVGRLDRVRAQQLLERLLEGVVTYQAKAIIVDITGVPVVDADVADALIRAAKAVKLLGAQAILTGIRPEVAQTLVAIGADLQQVVTQSSLQSGLNYALKRFTR